MPRNFKEGLLFTGIMCGLMVLGMSSWNLWLNHQFSFSHLVLGFLPGFAVALASDIFIAARLAKPIAFKLVEQLKNHTTWAVKKEMVVKIVFISVCMVLIMVTLMSFYGMVMRGVSFSLASYFRTWFFNFIIAVPLNLLVVGPLARLILTKVQTVTK